LHSFGKGVANHFVALYVIIQNKNQSLEYLLQDIRGGFPDYVVSSYDKQVPHDVSVKAEQFSARAIIFRVTAASASVLNGIAGFAGNTVLQEAANVFSGPAQTGLQSAIPDLSTTELSNLDRLGFSVTSTVIPKGGAIRVVAFIPSDILEPSDKNENPACKKEDGVGNKHQDGVGNKHHLFSNKNSLSTYKGCALRELFKTLTVQIAGIHVQQVTPSPVPTMKLFVTPITPQTDFTKKNSFAIEGSGLDSVKSVQLINGKTVVQAELEALSNATSKSIDPNVASLAIPAMIPTPGPGKYEINFILADGTIRGTTQSISVPTPPAPPVKLSPPSLDFTAQKVGTPSSQKISLTNSGTAQLVISKMELDPGAATNGFAQKNDCGTLPATLAVNASCTITVTLTPKSASDLTGKLTITDDAAGSPHTVNLTGKGQ